MKFFLNKLWTSFFNGLNILQKPFKEYVYFLTFLLCIILPCIRMILNNHADFIDIHLFITYLSIAITISYFFTTIVFIFKKLKIILYVLPLSILFLSLFLYIVFATFISPLTIIIISETNIQETKEFFTTFALTTKSLITYFMMITVLVIVVFLEKLKPKLCYKQVISTIITFCITISITHSYIIYNLIICNNSQEITKWYETYNAYGLDSFSALLSSIYIPHVSAKEMKNAIKMSQKIATIKHTVTETDSLTVILVIGESYIKKHAQIYGYELPTTPNMLAAAQSGNLFAFSDVITPYNTTTQSIKNLLSTNSIADREYWSEQPFFPVVFKQAGYEVYMWDNQKTLGTFLIYTFTLNSFIYNCQLQHISYSATNKEIFKYDHQLIDSFYDNQKKNDKYRFIIFHLMGQHVDPMERYPKEFNMFTYKDICRSEKYLDNRKKQYIAHYDNATLYNDFVIGKIMKYHKNTNAVMVYLSDHGEEAYDFRDSKGRRSDIVSDKTIMNYQNCVPFIVWCSDKYIKKHKNIIKDINNSLNRPYMIDNTCQLLFHLAGIESPCYKPERDIIHKMFKRKKRIVYDIYDYDFQ